MDDTNSSERKRGKLETNVLYDIPLEILMNIVLFNELIDMFSFCFTCRSYYEDLWWVYEIDKDTGENVPRKKSVHVKERIISSGTKTRIWFEFYLRKFRRKIFEQVSDHKFKTRIFDLLGNVCYESSTDYFKMLKNLGKREKFENETIESYVSKSSQRRNTSVSKSVLYRKRAELKAIVGLFCKQLSCWSRKNSLSCCDFCFKIDISLDGEQKNSYSGEANCVSSKFTKSAVVQEKEFSAVSLTSEKVTDAVVRTGLSESGYSYLKNNLFSNKSGIPAFSKVKNEILRKKEELYKSSQVILDEEKKPVGVMIPIKELLENDYSNSDVLMDLCVRSHFYGKIFLEEEKKYQKYCIQKGKENEVNNEKKGKLINEIRKRQRSYKVDPTYKADKNTITDENSLNFVFSTFKEYDEKIVEDEKVIKDLEEEKYRLKGNFERMKNKLNVTNKIGALTEKIQNIKLSRGKKKLTKALKRKINTLEEEIAFWEAEREFPEYWDKFTLSEKCGIDKIVEDDGNIYLHLRNLVRRGDDGHPIFKGGFTQFNFNENISSYMFPTASNPNRIENHQIVAQVLGPEKKELFKNILQSVSLDTDRINGVCMTRTFRVSLNARLKNEEKSTFSKFLLDEGILRKVDLKKLNDNFIRVKITNNFIYSADWKGLFLCYKNLRSFYSPFNTRTSKERKELDLKDQNEFPFVSTVFEHPRDMSKVLLRSEKNLSYLKSIPPSARLADVSLHGEKSIFQSGLFQGLLMSGMKNIGLKSKTLSIFESYGIVSSGISVSKENPLSVSHAKIGLFREKYEPMKKELVELYQKYEKKYVVALEVEEHKLETTNFRSQTSKNKCSAKIEKLRMKIDICKSLTSHQSEYMADLFALLNLLDYGNKVEKEDGYLCHSQQWMKKEFISFEMIKNTVIPILSNIQCSLKRLIGETDVSGYYFNHLVREYPLFLTKFFNTRNNQRTMERLGYILNRLYRNSSGFGGRERKIKRTMIKAKNNYTEKDEFIVVNRKIDTIISCRARFQIRKESKSNDYFM